MHSLRIVQWNSTRRDHPGFPGRVFGTGPVTLGTSSLTHPMVFELCRVSYARGWMRMCVEFRDEILLRGRECKTRENFNFSEKG